MSDNRSSDKIQIWGTCFGGLPRLICEMTREEWDAGKEIPRSPVLAWGEAHLPWGGKPWIWRPQPSDVITEVSGSQWGVGVTVTTEDRRVLQVWPAPDARRVAMEAVMRNVLAGGKERLREILGAPGGEGTVTTICSHGNVLPSDCGCVPSGEERQ